MLKKVLVVDDSELIHNMYRLMLKKYPGCVMISAKNGREGIERLEVENGIELILLDVNMPVMNGIQFLEHYSSNGFLKHIPVIMISTEGREEDLMRGLSLGARGYIVKPFKSINLHNMIESVLNKTAATSEGGRANGF